MVVVVVKVAVSGCVGRCWMPDGGGGGIVISDDEVVVVSIVRNDNEMRKGGMWVSF